MNTFTGTKQVKAIPMNRKAYNDLRDWPVPLDENPDDEGYLVEYVDGGKPNHKDFTGYISWSPKEQFENAYLNIGNTDGLKPFQIRLLAEQADLKNKIAKAKTYLTTVDGTEESTVDLLRQVNAMETYYDALTIRINKLV